jgi:hypothetical protein
MTSLPGKITSIDSRRNLAFLAFETLFLVMADFAQPIAVPLFAECFVIGAR